MRELIFVFGTLKEGFPNFARNAGRRLPGVFTTVERLPLYLVGERHSAWLVDRPGDGETVRGEVYEVDEAALAAMDALERVGAPDGYRRRRLRVVPAGATGASLEVFAYLKDPGQLAGADLRLGPLGEYTLEHAALYRARMAP
ncbi:MAG: gamma-glutamylcyclotransferase [Enhydrobacter sp.]|nr:MAG: gamma-glutamylcyclotransferase [Enhydrobacter sp.]